MVLLTQRTDSRVSFCQQANLLSTDARVKGLGGRDIRVIVSSLEQNKSEVDTEAGFSLARWVCCPPPLADVALSTGGRAPLVSAAVRLGMGGSFRRSTLSVESTPLSKYSFSPPGLSHLQIPPAHFALPLPLSRPWREQKCIQVS